MHEQLKLARPSRRWILRTLGLGLCGGLVASLPGCSLGVMFGKMLNGEPKVPASFRTKVREDLTKGKHTVLVVCSAPDSVDSENSTLAVDLIEGITRRMRLHGIKVIDPDLVARWIDENGGVGKDMSALAEDFDTDYIVSIDIQSFSYREPNSPRMLRGQATGFARAYDVVEVGGRRQTQMVFSEEFASIYPKLQPIAEQARSSQTFQKEYVSRVCDEMAEKFYDHRPGNDI